MKLSCPKFGPAKIDKQRTILILFTMIETQCDLSQSRSFSIRKVVGGGGGGREVGAPSVGVLRRIPSWKRVRRKFTAARWRCPPAARPAPPAFPLSAYSSKCYCLISKTNYDHYFVYLTQKIISVNKTCLKNYVTVVINLVKIRFRLCLSVFFLLPNPEP